MDSWLVTLIGIQVAFVAFLIWLGVNYRQKSLQRRSEERLRIVERFTSGKELADFLATERGARFLEQFAMRHKDPAGLIILGVVVGILALFLGAAFFYIMARTAEDFLFAAVFIVTGGFGILAATGVSYLLARKFRLLHGQRDAVSELTESD